MIKKILILLIAITAVSCSISDDSLNAYQEILPIESVNIPNEFVVGESYEVNLVYKTPTNCHSFNNIYYIENQNERTIAIISNVFDNNNCSSLNTESEASFNVSPTETGTSIFKFWRGIDGDGQDDYLIIEVPAIE